MFQDKLLASLTCASFSLLLLQGCGGTTTTQTSTGTGGSTTGGASTGGSTTGGASTGGSATGGASTGGSTTGGNGGTSSRVPTDHRKEAVSCVGVHDPPEPTNAMPNHACQKHADCTEGVNGKCVASGVGMAGNFYQCAYDLCADDSDCDPDKVCYCTESRSARCFSVGNCQTDADCGEGSFCSPSMSWDCGGHRPIDGYHCHTPQDSCIDDSDCQGTDYCNFDEYKGHWECTPVDTSCVIG